jgi:DNA-binding MarR family transcriptional regulator
VRLVHLFSLIAKLEHDPEPPTAARLAVLTGLTESGVHRLIMRLVAGGFIERSTIPAKQHRGRSLRLAVAESEEARRLGTQLAEAAPA